MNAIESLKRDIERALPRVETKLRKPRKESGHWWLDATYDGHAVMIEWSPKRGFGISTSDSEDGYGEGPDEVFDDRQAAAERAVELLARRTHSVPPNQVILRELRAALGVTQEQLASRLGVQQAAVSRLERRPDMTLSSLRRYVEALGGELEINVRTPDGEQLRLLDVAQRAKARATCEHATANMPLDDSAEGVGERSDPSVTHLAEMLGQLEQAARTKWVLHPASRLHLQNSSQGDLACSNLERAQISINSRAVSALTKMLSNILDPSSAASAITKPDPDACYRYLLGHEVGHFVRAESTSRTSALQFTDPELRADAIGGWLAGLAGDDPATGSATASLLGCRVSECVHPTPERRVFAFLAGHTLGSKDRLESATKMNLLVLRVADLEASRAFYAALGLELRPERHGTGPLHYSCMMQQTVMELYPRTEPSAQHCPVRLGFQSPKHALERLLDTGLLKQPPRVIRSQHDFDVYLLRDPDENTIELEVTPRHGLHPSLTAA